MSGGYFNYVQSQMQQTIEQLEEDLQNGFEYLTQETIDEFKKGLYYLKLAAIYIHRIDYLLVADDGEATFHEKLKEELEKV